MNDIIIFKEKHINITDSQVKDLLQNQIQLINHVKNKQNQHCNGNLLHYYMYLHVICIHIKDTKDIFFRR